MNKIQLENRIKDLVQAIEIYHSLCDGYEYEVKYTIELNKLRKKLNKIRDNETKYFKTLIGQE